MKSLFEWNVLDHFTRQMLLVFALSLSIRLPCEPGVGILKDDAYFDPGKWEKGSDAMVSYLEEETGSFHNYFTGVSGSYLTSETGKHVFTVSFNLTGTERLWKPSWKFTFDGKSFSKSQTNAATFEFDLVINYRYAFELVSQARYSGVELSVYVASPSRGKAQIGKKVAECCMENTCVDRSLSRDQQCTTATSSGGGTGGEESESGSGSGSSSGSSSSSGSGSGDGSRYTTIIGMLAALVAVLVICVIALAFLLLKRSEARRSKSDSTSAISSNLV